MIKDVATAPDLSWIRAIQGMYKGSEPITLQHSVRTEYCFRSPSEICPKFPKFPNFVRSSSIVFIEILLIFDNLSYFGVFFKKKKTLKFWEIFLFINKIRMNKH